MTGGLRERKKAKTRAAIRECAFRLFTAQGYDATTVEQIAGAAEVSPSTFFRYFPTKEDLVVADEYDPLLIAEFQAQPAAMRPTQALRAAMRAVFGAMPAGEMATVRQRMALMQDVPALRAAFMDQLAQSLQALEEMAARRVGRDPADIDVRTFAGAAIGVMLSAYVHWVEDPASDFMARADAMLGALEQSLRL